MNIQLSQLVTILATGFAAVAPMVLPFIPPPYNLAATGIIAALGALYHLFQPSPTSVAKSIR